MVPPPSVPTRCEELSAFTDEFAKVRLRDGHGKKAHRHSHWWWRRAPFASRACWRFCDLAGLRLRRLLARFGRLCIDPPGGGVLCDLRRLLGRLVGHCVHPQMSTLCNCRDGSVPGVLTCRRWTSALTGQRCCRTAALPARQLGYLNEVAAGVVQLGDCRASYL